MSASSKKTMIGTIVLHSLSVIFLLSFLGYEYGILKGTSEPIRYAMAVQFVEFQVCGKENK